ncbi:hypothetical protein PZA11_005340 [Diplocarpon coronariae]
MRADGLPLVDIQTISSLRSSPPPAASAEDGYAPEQEQEQGQDRGPARGQEEEEEEEGKEEGEEDREQEERDQVREKEHELDPPRSPAFSTSSTADNDSSPILPPLPAPTLRGRNFGDHQHRTPSGSPSVSSSHPGSSHYYTASWGSPYQQPAAASRRTRSHGHSYSLSSETSEDSPIRHLEFHTPFLRPAPTFSRLHTDPEFVSHDGLISAAVLANRARRPATGLTEDWIRQHTGGQSAERNNWLSDTGDSERSSVSGGSEARDWLGGESDPRTPTLRSFSGSREAPRRPRHRRQLTTDTLTQEGFAEDFLDHAIPTMSLTNEQEVGAQMQMSRPSPEEEIPPPPPPKDGRAAVLPAQSLTPAPGPPRLKKKVPWKGKNIMVLLPWDDERGQKGQAPTPLTEEDMAAMLKEWEQLGYDTTGFNLGPEPEDRDEGSRGQSRSPWPLVQDVANERAQRSYRVSIPDRREWDAYVQDLQEAKLQALLGALGDVPPAISPAVSNLNSRRTSMQYPALPFSPPIPTSSAASSHLTHQQNTFSPLLVPGAGISTSQSSNPGSVASPASMHARIGSVASPGPMHMPGKYSRNQSISFGSEHPFGSPFQYPQQNSPGVWSPQQMLYQQSVARAGSPSLQNLNAAASPASSFSQDGYFAQGGDVLSQMQQRQQLLQTQLAHQQQLQLQGGARASPRLQEVKEAEEEEVESKSPSKTPEARLRNNPNDLQKEIDDAEYHLEEQMQRELEHADYSPHSEKSEDRFPQEPVAAHTRNISSMGLAASRFANEDSDGPVLHHPQPHSRGHSLSQRPFQDDEEGVLASRTLLSKPDLSDIETNPSNLGTPVQSNEPSGSGNDSMSNASNHWLDSDAAETSTVPKSGRVSRASTSGLNVAAKEFIFDPTISFKPGQSSFGNSFQSSINAFPSFQPSVSATSSQFSHQRIASSKSNINVAAPAFMPGHKDFNFSSSGPAFRPDAPAFTPFNSTLSDSVGSGTEASRPSIFGNIDLGALGISKPAKKNKAIPIVRPDSGHKPVVNEDVEDKDGRITQGEGRFKRARGGKDDGDSVPLFAAPTMPLGETSREQSPPKGTSGIPTALADKENSAPEELEEGEIVEDASSKPGKDWTQWEFHQQKQAEDFNAARQFTSQPFGSEVPAYASFVPSEDGATKEPQKMEGHTKNTSSLSAKAKPFDFRPGAFDFTFGQPGPPPVSKPLPMSFGTGLLASKYARSPTPPPRQPTPAAQSPGTKLQPHERAQFQDTIPQAESFTPQPVIQESGESFQGQTLEDIDEIMRLMNQAESAPVVYQPSPQRHINMPDPDNSSPVRLLPNNGMPTDAPSPSPRRFKALPGESKIFSRVHEDPFVAEDSPRHQVNNEILDSVPPSEWDDVLSETEEAKLHPRAKFFDNHVNDLVGGLLSQRIEPLERTLENIQMSLDMMTAKGHSMRERRSFSGALSDADDEDEDNPRRSMSPRRDKRLDKIKAIVIEAIASQGSRPATANTSVAPDTSHVLKALEEMKEQLGGSMRLDLRGEDIRNIIEEAVQKRLPASPKRLDEEAAAREVSYKAKIAELEERLLRADSDTSKRSADLEEKLLRADMRTEEETKTRRAAEDRLAEVQRLLRISSEEETRLREAIDERELTTRGIIDAADAKARGAEEQRAQANMRIALLEAAQTSSQKDHTELQFRLSSSEAELRDARKEIQRWQLDAERALDAAKRHSEDAEVANETNAGLQRTVNALQAQMEESIRVREVMRGRLTEAQADMASAARSIASDLAVTAKKEAELVARQEVLDAKLQAEARTRERLELEIERLEQGERDGLRAVSELRKVNAELEEVKAENDRLERESGRFKREFEEARESGLSEVQRTRHYMQLEIDTANNQVNVVREALEHNILQLKSEMDQIKLDSDTAHTKSEMLLEEAENSKQSALKELQAKFADREEDLLTRHERALGNKEEDAQRNEQHLLERLSLSSAKTEHLQDRVAHLEEKLEISNRAAAAAVSAAKTARSASSSSPPFAQGNPPAPGGAGAVKTGLELPEKISPQALRESIMVLQEQLQARESTIESLSSQLETVDVEAPSKIQKRDDEISWLRELLAVRKSDLQDIVAALETERYDPDRVRDAAIRLRANLQMEEQERERKENGSGAGTVVDNLARLRGVAIASPRVAQAVGPLAAAWGNWRKGRAVDVTGGSGSSTTSRANSPARQNLLGGLLTTPANPAPAPTRGEGAGGRQPTAFESTGQRFTGAQLANRPRNLSANRTPNNSSPLVARNPNLGQEQSSVRGNTTTSSTTRGLRAGSGNRKRGTFGGGLLGGQDLAVVAGAAFGSTAGFARDAGGSERGGMTPPPMMRQSSYDADARGLGEDGEFSDAGFYDDESFGGEEAEGFGGVVDIEPGLDG